MTSRASIAIATATLMAIGGAFLLPAEASAASGTHTLKFTSVMTNIASLGGGDLGESDTLKAAGKVVGFDTIHGSVKSNKAAISVDVEGGFLYGTLKLSSGAVTHGRVTGGTGKFKGVTGTIVGTNANKSGSRTNVVIKYHS